MTGKPKNIWINYHGPWPLKPQPESFFVNNQDLEKLARKFPLSEATRRRNQVGPVGTPAANPQPVEGLPLECVHKGKEKSGGSHVESDQCDRYKIVITIHAVRPADWDGYHCKEILDCLVKAGFLDDDNWRICPTGTVTTKKVHSKAEERTEIEVIPINQ
jgi:hypothetical protein